MVNPGCAKEKYRGSDCVRMTVWVGMTVVAATLAVGSAAAQSPGVSVKDDGVAWVMSNAYVTATISKTTGDMVSLKCKVLETMGYVSGHHAGYWEQNPSGAARLDAKLTIDPAANSGERGEVSVKDWSDGESLTAHPRFDPATRIENAAEQLGPEAPNTGHGVLRVALDGVNARSIDVGVNGRSAGQIAGLIYNATINRDGIEGWWVEKDLSFDAALLKAGENTLTLTVPEGGLMSGVSYDVVRLELSPK